MAESTAKNWHSFQKIGGLNPKASVDSCTPIALPDRTGQRVRKECLGRSIYGESMGRSIYGGRFSSVLILN